MPASPPNDEAPGLLTANTDSCFSSSRARAGGTARRRSARVRNSKWWPQARQAYSNKGMVYILHRARHRAQDRGVRDRLSALFGRPRPGRQRRFSRLHAGSQFTVFGSPSPFWDAFARHDSGWYWQIARYGYTEGAGAYVPGGRSGIAFFPAYPTLMSYVGRALGRRPADLYFGGLIVSWVAFALAMIAMYRAGAARSARAKSRARRAAHRDFSVRFLFRRGLHGGAVPGGGRCRAVYLFRTKRWVLGGLCGALATATRVNGILMWPALLWIVWQQFGPGAPPDLASEDAVRDVRGSPGEAATCLGPAWALLLVPARHRRCTRCISIV